jgi:hypothetical protein
MSINAGRIQFHDHPSHDQALGPGPGAWGSDKPSDNDSWQRQTERGVLRHRNPSDVR